MFVLEVVEALTKEDVSFAIVGGYAVALHGAVRGTVDVDIVLSFTKRNYESCECALLSLGLTSKLPVSANDIFQFREEYIKERNLRAWSFYDSKDPTRIVDVIITHKGKRLPVKIVNVKGKKIPILAKKELIKMKQEAGRLQDLEDVKALRELQ
ncbi:MAG: hypothetical protein KDD48_06535 [Bdellovibrionales bacterium]|nr:hypothetical protein [Bdellovibrionales bacterium]